MSLSSVCIKYMKRYNDRNGMRLKGVTQLASGSSNN